MQLVNTYHAGSMDIIFFLIPFADIDTEYTYRVSNRKIKASGFSSKYHLNDVARKHLILVTKS